MKVILEFYNKNHQFIQSLGFSTADAAIKFGKQWEKSHKDSYFVTIM